MKQVDVLVVGGGPAGMAAAIGAYDAGCRDVLVLERDMELGGILLQCIHNGFGLQMFREELTGPEYASRYMKMLGERPEIHVQCDTMVLDITPEKLVTVTSPVHGMQQIQARAIVLAMGCRERSRGAIGIPGARCAGIYTAGTAQRLVNMEGFLPGKRIVILGSGDIGLIMARRMKQEGADVVGVYEVLPHSKGLQRNIVQCLQDNGIPLYLSRTAVRIQAENGRLHSVIMAKVDEAGKTLPGTEEEVLCDTLLCACGLIPENELSKTAGVQMDANCFGPVVDESLQTSVPGIFACGNVLHVHDLVDYVSAEGNAAGQAAACFVAGGVPQRYGSFFHAAQPHPDIPADTATRKTVTCVVCPNGCPITVEFSRGAIRAISGQGCPRGEKYARQEMTAPERMVTTLMMTSDAKALPIAVRTTHAIPREKIPAVLAAIHSIHPSNGVERGQVLIRNVAETGADVIVTRPVFVR